MLFQFLVGLLAHLDKHTFVLASSLNHSLRSSFITAAFFYRRWHLINWQNLHAVKFYVNIQEVFTRNIITLNYKFIIRTNHECIVDEKVGSDTLQCCAYPAMGWMGEAGHRRLIRIFRFSPAGWPISRYNSFHLYLDNNVVDQLEKHMLIITYNKYFQTKLQGATSWEVIPHPPYSPDLVQFPLFCSLSDNLREMSFNNNVAFQN